MTLQSKYPVLQYGDLYVVHPHFRMRAALNNQFYSKKKNVKRLKKKKYYATF